MRPWSAGSRLVVLGTGLCCTAARLDGGAGVDVSHGVGVWCPGWVGGIDMFLFFFSEVCGWGDGRSRNAGWFLRWITEGVKT